MSYCVATCAESETGREFSGDKLVQLVFLDESGTGDLVREPDIVMAGVIVDADKQAVRVMDYLSQMADKYVPLEYRRGFCFHAKRLFSGCKEFPRCGVLDSERRHVILEELCSIPEQFNLAVIGARRNRATVARENPQLSKQKDIDILAIGACALMCLVQVQHFMSRRPQNEFSAVWLERNNLSDELVKNIARTHSDPHGPRSFFSSMVQLPPLGKIMAGISFQDKIDSSLLQVADACAWAIRKRVSQGSSADRFFGQFSSRLLESAQHSLSLT